MLVTAGASAAVHIVIEPTIPFAIAIVGEEVAFK